MKCQKCGTDLKEGAIFCDHCGNKVLVVQDYDDSAENISEKLIREEALRQREQERLKQLEEKNKAKKKNAVIFGIIGAVAVVAIIFVISMVVTNKKNSRSFEFQYAAAEDNMRLGLYDKAYDAVEKALAIEPENERALLLLSNICLKLNDDDGAIDALLSCISLNPTSFEAYTSIIKIYSERGDFEAIKALADNVEDDTIILLFRDYLPETPEFGTEEGTYDDEFQLEIFTDNNSVIYYTIDGSDPKETGMLYSEPIDIPVGTILIRAIATNEYGIYSDEITAKYTVELKVPDKPIVSLPSGTYSEL
ncbi:MAG: chitobiase/beta-hexosaminidase C-terminal domain-containing protein, partial [Lachnospiraceae bacterium]|nr:chitobiase/beta-hexosaminidase C-terminal domain-containing protein [Lachnospiraceae bacterium]